MTACQRQQRSHQYPGQTASISSSHLCFPEFLSTSDRKTGNAGETGHADSRALADYAIRYLRVSSVDTSHSFAAIAASV